MGLDMYLTKRTYVGANYEHRKVTGVVDIRQNNKPVPVKLERISYIDEQIAYWRKANQIHNWFTQHCAGGIDECQPVNVSQEQLKTLLDLCKQVKKESILVPGKVHTSTVYKDGKMEEIMEDGKIVINEEKLKELLPVRSGFFFGSTDYDEYYMQDIDYTIETLEKILGEIEEGEYPDFIYQASW